MGQFIAVSAREPAIARNLIRECTAAGRWLFGLKPQSCAIHATSGVAGFNRTARADDSGRVDAFEELNAWALGAGTWVDHAGSGQAAATARFAAAHADAGATESAAAAIDGQFVFISGSMSDGSLQIVTDPLGQLHAYILQLPDAILVSTSALLLAQIGDCDWDMLAVREFLARGTVYEDRSLFRGIRKIPPAAVVSLAGGEKTSSRTYWSIRAHLEEQYPGRHCLVEYADAMQTAVGAIYRHFGQPVLDITGGFDSRIILAGARCGVAGHSLATTVTGSKTDADVVAANRIGREFDLDHRWLESPIKNSAHWWRLAERALPLVDGEYDILEYARILAIHETLSERYDASINGSGGELIRGYWWELLFPRIGARDRFDPATVATKRYATDHWAEHLLAEDFSESLTGHFSGVIERESGELKGCRNTACMDNVYLRLRMQRWQGRIASATNRVWPCFSPMLFRKPLELSVGAPVALRRNGRMARRLLALMDRGLAEMPMAGGYPALPVTPGTLPRFAPLGREYAGRIRNRATGMLQRNQARQPPPDEALKDLLSNTGAARLVLPDEMLTAPLYSPAALRDVCRNAVAGNLPAAHVGRLLTLEKVARLSREYRTHGA